MLDVLEEAPELAQSLGGASMREMGSQLGCSHETARKIIQAQGRALVQEVAGQLLLARRAGEALPIAIVPDVDGAGFSLALRYVDFLVAQLALLTFHTRITIEPVEGGFVVSLSEIVDSPDAEGGAE